MLTIFFWRWISGISLAVWDNKILVTCYVYVVRVAVRVPQQVIFKWCDQFTSKVPNCYWSIPESQEQLQLIQKNKGRWSHKLSPAHFCQLKVPYLNTIRTQVSSKLKPKLPSKSLVWLHGETMVTSRIWRFSPSCLTRSFSLNCSMKSTFLLRWRRWLKDFKTVPSSMERIFRGTELLVLV